MLEGVTEHCSLGDYKSMTRIAGDRAMEYHYLKRCRDVTCTLSLVYIHFSTVIPILHPSIIFYIKFC